MSRDLFCLSVESAMVIKETVFFPLLMMLPVAMAALDDVKDGGKY